jgi:UDP-N-acetylglucosamine 4,6-dehydratase/5-epimerase
MCRTISNRTIAVLGGTGSLGKQLVRRLLQHGPKSVVVYSRGENKQFEMRRELNRHDNIEYVIGDVRDRHRLREVFRRVDTVVNVAAIKHVPVCEEAPVEALLTNVLGAVYVREEAVAAGVESVISVSTDKAVLPINVLGMTKAMQERVCLMPISRGENTRIVTVRYGNVLGSRGSVVPFFCDLIDRGLPITITNPLMTRFMLTIEDAVDAVIHALACGTHGQVWIRRSKSLEIIEMARVLSYGRSGRPGYEMEVVGVRPGEKMHETLVSAYESVRTCSNGDYYCIEPFRATADGEWLSGEITSESSERMGREEIDELLRSQGWFGARRTART